VSLATEASTGGKSGKLTGNILPPAQIDVTQNEKRNRDKRTKKKKGKSEEDNPVQ